MKMKMRATAGAGGRKPYDPVVRGSLGAYGFATIWTALASFLGFGIEFFEEDIVPFTPFYPAVLFAALLGGWGPGLLAAALGGLIGWWAFIPPKFTFLPMSRGHLISLAMYMLAAALMVWGAGHFRKLMKRLEDGERFRALVVQELGHRLRNKVATIAAIISIQLRDYPKARDGILGQLHAMSAADDLIEAAEGRGADIHDIIVEELSPYAASRLTMKGPHIFLAPKLALAVALLIHELATNAAKHGSLSVPAGRVSACWFVNDCVMQLEWCECDGPVVKPPARRGFGLRLLSSALEPFGGVVQAAFPSTGMKCSISVKLPEEESSGDPETPREITSDTAA